MANVFAVNSVGNSLVRYLDTSYPTALRNAHPCQFRLFSSNDLTATSIENIPNTVSLFLYRVAVDEHLRNAGTPGSPQRPLSLQLHFMMTAWSDSAITEHVVFTWAMRQLHERPLLDPSALTTEAGWTAADTIHVVPADIGVELMMRIWDALEPPYRLSACYIARVVRVDPDTEPDSLPVVAMRMDYREQELPR